MTSLAVTLALTQVCDEAVPLENAMRPSDLRLLGDQAAWVYSLIRPLRTGLRSDLLSIDVGHHRAGGVTFVGRDALRYALVGPGGVVVVLIFREDGSQVRFAEDQRPVEDFAAQRADEALADRVHPGCLDGADQNPGSCAARK